MTSRWVHLVADQRDYDVEWRLISLRLLNRKVDYDAQFPPEYEAGHTAGLRLLRVLAGAREEHGAQVLGGLYDAMGARIWDTATPPKGGAAVEVAAPALAEVGLPAELATALDDDAWDDVVLAETEEALALTGRDVGTPILHIAPPDGAAFFGPVISRLPSKEDAVRLWDHVVGLATFPGFAEMKRSLRELPQLAALGVTPEQVGVQEDWHGGSRRQHR